MSEVSQITVFDGYEEQNVEVLFQEEVQLDINVPLFYIKSGEKEIQSYVDQISKPELNVYTENKKEEISAAADEYVEETVLPEIDNYVDANVIPELNQYKTAAENAKTGAVSAAASAAASATEAETAAALAAQSAAQAETSATSAAQSAVQAETAAASAGVPVGGATGEVLRKSSDADRATEWADIDTVFVHKTGNETISGAKTFEQKPICTGIRNINNQNDFADVHITNPENITMWAQLRAKRASQPSTGYWIGVGSTVDGNPVTYAYTPPAGDNSSQIATTTWVRNHLANNGLRFLNYANGVTITPPSQSAPYTCPYDLAYVANIQPRTTPFKLYVNGKETAYIFTISDGYNQNKSAMTIFLKKGDVIYWSGTLTATYSSVVYPLS